MRPVLFLLGTLGAGGSETKFAALAQRFDAAGKPVHVAYLGPPETILSRLDGLRIVNLERKGKWSLKAFRKLSAYIEKHSITSVVAVNPYPLAYAVPLAVFRRNNKFDVLSSINTSEIQSKRERMFMRLYVPLLNRCRQIIFGSARQKQEWLETYSIPDARSAVIYNGVDGEFFDESLVAASREEIRASLDIPADASVIVCVSRLRPEKAHRNLLQAVAALDKKHRLNPFMVFVGDGDERPRIEAHAQQLFIGDRLRLVGVADDVRPYLKAADIFALTSTAVETFSNSALEASAMGLPVVISDVGGANEMFPPASSGTVYPRDDIDSLTEALATRLHSVLSGEFDRHVARDRVLKTFSIMAMDEAWEKAIWTQGGSQAS